MKRLRHVPYEIFLQKIWLFPLTPANPWSRSPVVLWNSTTESTFTYLTRTGLRVHAYKFHQPRCCTRRIPICCWDSQRIVCEIIQNISGCLLAVPVPYSTANITHIHSQQFPLHTWPHSETHTQLRLFTCHPAPVLKEVHIVQKTNTTDKSEISNRPASVHSWTKRDRILCHVVR